MCPHLSLKIQRLDLSGPGAYTEAYEPLRGGLVKKAFLYMLAAIEVVTLLLAANSESAPKAQQGSSVAGAHDGLWSINDQGRGVPGGAKVIAAAGPSKLYLERRGL